MSQPQETSGKKDAAERAGRTGMRDLIMRFRGDRQKEMECWTATTSPPFKKSTDKPQMLTSNSLFSETSQTPISQKPLPTTLINTLFSYRNLPPITQTPLNMANITNMTRPTQMMTTSFQIMKCENHDELKVNYSFS